MRGLKSYQRRAGMKEWFAETNMWFNNINIDKKRLSGFSFKHDFYESPTNLVQMCFFERVLGRVSLRRSAQLFTRVIGWGAKKDLFLLKLKKYRQPK